MTRKKTEKFTEQIGEITDHMKDDPRFNEIQLKIAREVTDAKSGITLLAKLATNMMNLDGCDINFRTVSQLCLVSSWVFSHLLKNGKANRSDIIYESLVYIFCYIRDVFLQNPIGEKMMLILTNRWSPKVDSPSLYYLTLISIGLGITICIYIS